VDSHLFRAGKPASPLRRDLRQKWRQSDGACPGRQRAEASRRHRSGRCSGYRPAGAPRVIEFTDPDCPYCQALERFWLAKEAEGKPVQRLVYFVSGIHPRPLQRRAYPLLAGPRQRSRRSMPAHSLRVAQMPPAPRRSLATPRPSARWASRARRRSSSTEARLRLPAGRTRGLPRSEQGQASP
jgi:hypothetical protein